VTGIAWLTYDLFAHRVGEPFDVGLGGDATVGMVLAEATESQVPGGRGPEGQERRQFSLVFRGTTTPGLPQGTYRVEHAELGDLDLFLVPIGPDAEGMRYEAAFA
jgi:hypothetical protein